MCLKCNKARMSFRCQRHKALIGCLEKILPFDNLSEGPWLAISRVAFATKKCPCNLKSVFTVPITSL